MLSCKESPCSVGDLGSIRAVGRSLGEGKGYPLQYSGLENSMDCMVHGFVKNRTRLSQLSLHLTVFVHLRLDPSLFFFLFFSISCFSDVEKTFHLFIITKT